MGLAVGVVVARLLGRVEVQRGGVDAIPDMGEKMVKVAAMLSRTISSQSKGFQQF